MATVAAVVACSARASTPANGRTCEERRAHLMQVLNELPREGLAAPIEVALPSSTLSGTFGKGTILELAGTRLAVNGVEIAAKEQSEQLAALRRLVAEADSELPIYIAAAWDVDVATLHPYLEAIPEQYELKLLYSVPPAPLSPNQAESTQDDDLASAVLAERDVSKRRSIADGGYGHLVQCDAVQAALPALEGVGVRERWPRVRELMLEKLPACQCENINADPLRHLLVAEQRAGTVALGAIPANFLRDRRCSAAMPLDTTQQVLDEIDEFDAEFAGDWKDDALVFDKVVTNDRLLVYMCVARPEETLAYVQAKSKELYWKVPGSNQCQAWRFEQLARNAPMGTWRRVGEGEPLAIHYRQGASEIRLFGPVAGGSSKPTDAGPWGCNEDLEMASVDDRSIDLEDNGRWYFDKASCEAAPDEESLLSGCIANLAAGIAPPPIEPTMDAEAASPSDAASTTPAGAARDAKEARAPDGAAAQ